ncbi:MAG: FtsQ-type POTRA domain-containing protein [Actinobacteria bacterium]|nr:FtsQ-type POTRA domain-containing protein [Actinomycetota bacterium]
MANGDKNYQKILAARKRRNIKRKFLLVLWIFLFFCFFLLMIWGFNYFYNSSYFKVKNIKVTGNEKYSENEIYSVAKLFQGLNVFEVDKKKIEDTLLTELIWIKSVTLKKIFPDKIELDVIERKPYVKAFYASDYYIIDDEGIVLEKIDAKDLKNYDNIITVKNALKYRPSTGEKIAKKNLLSCGLIYKILDLELKQDVKEAYISKDFEEDIVFLMINNKKIIFGTSDRIQEKNAILREVLDRLKTQEITYSEIDISNVDNPVIR